MKYYILNSEYQIEEINGKEFKEDSRLFIHKRNGYYVLTDKKTGRTVRVCKQLKDVKERYFQISDKYNSYVESVRYMEQVEEFKFFLKEHNKGVCVCK